MKTNVIAFPSPKHTLDSQLRSARQALFRDAGAQYNDILYFSRASDWRFQFTTPNASTHYVYFNFNLKDGPVVLEVPPTVGAGLFGSLVDAWEVPVTDVGRAGDDQGKGGKYLLVPPNWKEAIPDGYFVAGTRHRLQTRTSAASTVRLRLQTSHSVVRPYPFVSTTRPVNVAS